MNDIKNSTNEALCAIIVCFRYFKLFEDKAILCMQELSRRRSEGDEFDFEKYIEDELKSLPKTNFNSKSLSNIINFKG